MLANETSHVIALVKDSIVNELASRLQKSPDAINQDLPFDDMGADSLILLETLHDINQKYQVSLSVGDLYENYNTIAKVASYIHGAGQWQQALQVETMHAASNQRSVKNTLQQASEQVASNAPAQSRAADQTVNSAVATGGVNHMDRMPSYPAVESAQESGLDRQRRRQAVEAIIRQQIDLMERQFNFLAQSEIAATENAKSTTGDSSQTVDAGKQIKSATIHPLKKPAETPPQKQNVKDKDRFSAFSIMMEPDHRKDDRVKKDYIDNLAESFNGKTAQSKALTEKYRHVLADNRAVAGFRPLLKQLVYPILAEQAQGAHITDIDGNSYLDFTMGFGTHLFGHNPECVTEAIKRQIDIGMPIGPQSPLAGQVAQLVCELTGHSRVAFCNSGTEATMTAVRLARAATKKDKIVIFRNSYHGTFDGFIARAKVNAEESLPASLGTPQSFIADTLVLDYGEQSAIDCIERYHSEIAAVVIEPVQSRVPSLQPKAFLSKLRQISQQYHIAFIFDEVITGFRCAVGGAQEFFGVKADLCAYGKVVGGGMPIGLVAGSEQFLNGIDGGPWRFDDNSYPTAPTIFFAGTFSKHPLTLAASLAVLKRLKESGKGLITTLNRRTQHLVERLNRFFTQQNIAIQVDYFSSLFRFSSNGNIDLFFHNLINAGFYIWEGRNCFLSTAHKDADIDSFADCVEAISLEMKTRGLLPLREPEQTQEQNALTLPISSAQQRFMQLESSGTNGSTACNICFGLLFQEGVETNTLLRAVRSVIKNQNALWSRFDIQEAQQVAKEVEGKDTAIAQISITDRPASIEHCRELLSQQQSQKFDIRVGKNFSIQLYNFSDKRSLLSLCSHHLVCDGWGFSVLLERIANAYNQPEGQQGAADVSFAKWIEVEQGYRQSDRYCDDKTFWQQQLHAIWNYQAASVPDNMIGARRGGRARISMDIEQTESFTDKAKRCNVTPFTWLLACFQLFLNRVYQDKPPIIGVPFANRTSNETKQIVGNCVNLLPLLPYHERPSTFVQSLEYTKASLNQLFPHAAFPYGEICSVYGSMARDSGVDISGVGLTPVTVTFNIEPVTELPNFGHVQAELIAPDNRYIEFDLMFNLFLLKSGLRIELDYNTERFTAENMYAWLKLFEKIVEIQ